MVWWAVACKVVQVARVLSKLRESIDQLRAKLVFCPLNICWFFLSPPGE